MKRARQFLMVGVFFLINGGLTWSDGKIETVRPDGQPNRAAWMAEGTFGIMTHYLVQPQGNTPAEKTADLNRIVNQFDLDFYIRQIEETGADWLIFTLAQGTGYLSSRCDTIDRLEKGYSPERDLVREIGQRLHGRGKKLIIYLPGPYAGSDPTIKRLLGLGSEGFIDRHNAFIREYAAGLGRLLDGWWFDSCGPQDNALWQKEMEACRAGNPEAVVAFSGAEFCASSGQIMPLCPIEDYHAGEIHLLEDSRIRTDFLWPPGEGIIIDAQCKLRKQGQEPKFYLPDAQFIGNVQWHCLLPIDLSFNPAVPNQYCHYTDAELFRFVDAVKAVGGAITINVPIGGASGPAGVDTSSASFIGNGHIPQDTQAQLVRLGKHLQEK
ncbi:MAG: hypothetical protein BWY71_00826 [Planctomycetes bacterium ADurb.Bin412]|nr:MAG: hypothetical protein BWY71_00826 [Planctomycetes bacterium ADurb.Bin412]